MRFHLKTLFVLTGVIAATVYLFISMPESVAWPAGLLISVAALAILARKQSGKLATICSVIGVLLFLYLVSDGIFLAIRPVVLRTATSSDKIRDEYFCVHPMPGMAVRNVVVAEGTFSKSTWLTAVLYVVQAGRITELNGLTVGRSPNRLGEPQWIGMKMTLALADAKFRTGRVTQLGVVGETRGGGNGGGRFVHNVRVVEKQTFVGRMRPGQMRIVYVEGDRKFTVGPKMTIEEFAKANSGNFVVVVAGLE